MEGRRKVEIYMFVQRDQGKQSLHFDGHRKLSYYIVLVTWPVSACQSAAGESVPAAASWWAKLSVFSLNDFSSLVILEIATRI